MVFHIGRFRVGDGGGEETDLGDCRRAHIGKGGSDGRTEEGRDGSVVFVVCVCVCFLGEGEGEVEV